MLFTGAGGVQVQRDSPCRFFSPSKVETMTIYDIQDMPDEMADKAAMVAHELGILSGVPFNCFFHGAAWANEQNAAEIADMKFRIEGDAILLQAANQTIEKERAKVAGYQSEQTGLRQTISDQFGRIIDLEGDKAELLAALQKLYDEQNDAPLETRRHEWNRAMARAGELLKKYEHDGK